MEPMAPQRIEISYKTIIFTAFFLIFLWVFYQIREIVFLVFLSFIAASGLRPAVDGLEKIKIPRVAAILFVYLLLILFLVVTLYLIIPLLIDETIKMIQELIYFFSPISPYFNITPDKLTEQLGPISSNILKATVSVVSNLFSFFTFFVFTFYLLMERRHMRTFLRSLLGEEMKERLVKLILQIEERLGAWVRAELMLGTIIGVMTYVGLMFLNIESALPLAILAGVLELVPIIGPILSAIPAVIIAFVVSPWLALATALLYLLIQQLENQLIVPYVMKKAIGLPPMVTILAILIGGKLSGFVGMLLSIPVLVCLQIIIPELMSIRDELRLRGMEEKVSAKL